MVDRMDLVWWNSKTTYLRSYPFMKGSVLNDELNSEVLSDGSILEDLQIVLENIEDQILEVEKMAHEHGCRPVELQTGNGDFMLRPLIVAKASAIAAIVTLRSMEQTAEKIILNQYIYGPMSDGKLEEKIREGIEKGPTA